MAEPDPRATDWRILDGPRPRGAQVHVGQVVEVNGQRANIHLHPTEPIVVLTNGPALRSETLLRLTVEADDVTFVVRDGQTAPETLGGWLVRVPPAHAERSWCEVRSTEPLPVIPNGSHYPRRSPGGAPMTSTRWVRLHVQVSSVEFGYREADRG